MNILITEKEFQEYRKLQQDKEQLIKWLDEALETQHDIMSLKITMWKEGYTQGKIDILDIILSILKESDKQC